MVNKVLIAAAAADALFLASGILELTFSVIVKNDMVNDPSDGRDAIRHLIYERMPLTAGIVNAGFILAAFLATLPGLLMPTTRGWLKFAGYFVTFCTIFTMCVGVYLWIMTLRIGEDFFEVYMDLDADVQALVQTTFECCGYKSSTSPAFITNPTCPSPAAAALLPGCQAAVSNFANVLLDQIFTAVFGVVGIDVVFILAIACLSKDRKEREWYRRVDQKRSFW
ncbi:hypothetical protein ACRE_025860 [Hapsidospora chrysogenum ATCC 11550]|uniref:Tetraspanin-like protein n=1 Tax=Hapsidospora chrysogenum (strain ATCC 11550 / CBS 779.69 / DSM 880 / IAM 14645 / JCM 23072 / IMI 49137) TaxID=857340 RepID=A0A086TB20_HAPC1|nr:hypothetical protein ACRE_025860 [Hapsidospora chrysogenum ATCC 11550]